MVINSAEKEQTENQFNITAKKRDIFILKHYAP